MPVVSITQDQRLPLTGLPVDVFTITFTLQGREGLFTVQVDKTDAWVDAAIGAIHALADQVNAVYSSI